MAQRLKRWESPRSEGRNHKGKGGSARQRQKRKQLKQLAQRLKQNHLLDRPANPANALADSPSLNQTHSKTDNYAVQNRKINNTAKKGGMISPLFYWRSAPRYPINPVPL